MSTIVFKKLTPDQAGELFPGSIDDDILEIWTYNATEADYFQLGAYEGKLYGCTYEISWNGWSVWDPKEARWRDLDDADNDLFNRLERYGEYEDEESSFQFIV